MLLCKVAFIVLLAVPLNGQKWRNNAKSYKIPEPKVMAYSPRGFSVSIEHTPGIRLFAFHGSINKELKDLAAGEFSKDILHVVDGKWTFEDTNTRLRVGDIIYYWLFVIKDDLGYRLDDGWFEVTELVDNPHHSPDNKRPTLPPITPLPDTHGDSSCNTIPPQPTTPEPDRDREEFLRVCEFTVLNATQALLSLQSQMDSLRKTNQQLTTLLEKYPDGKKLKLSGRIPSEDDALSTVRFIIRGKLDLNPDIVSAVRNADDSITFQLSTLAEKLEILEVAKVNLKNSRIVIS